MLRVVPLRGARNGAPTWLIGRKRAVMNSYPQNPGPPERSGPFSLGAESQPEYIDIETTGDLRIAHIIDANRPKRTGSELGTKKPARNFGRSRAGFNVDIKIGPHLCLTYISPTLTFFNTQSVVLMKMSRWPLLRRGHLMAISAQDIAVAVEGINRIPSLSPLARRLALELISRTDRKRGVCFPSEGRLALSLGCDERSIRRAKVELRERGLLTWENRGQHKTPLYRIAWAAIKTLAQAIKRRIRQVSEPLVVAAAEAKVKMQSRIASVLMAPRPSSPSQNSGRTFSSNDPSQFYNINSFRKKGFGKGGDGDIPNPSRIAPEQAYKNAEKRFWADLGKLPQDTFIALTAALSPEQQQQAVEVEKRKFGTGVPFVLGILRTSEVA